MATNLDGGLGPKVIFYPFWVDFAGDDQRLLPFHDALAEPIYT